LIAAHRGLGLATQRLPALMQDLISNLQLMLWNFHSCVFLDVAILRRLAEDCSSCSKKIKKIAET
jgi:hypothetical protein